MPDFDHNVPPSTPSSPILPETPSTPRGETEGSQAGTPIYIQPSTPTSAGSNTMPPPGPGFYLDASTGRWTRMQQEVTQNQEMEGAAPAVADDPYPDFTGSIIEFHDETHRNPNVIEGWVHPNNEHAHNLHNIAQDLGHALGANSNIIPGWTLYDQNTTAGNAPDYTHQHHHHYI